jgi:AAA15 family ATPase/GTPase
MLIEFSVGNYRSFKDVVTFSMLAAPIQHPDENIDRNNVFAANKEIDLLRSAAIYGANASGKSNLIRALSFMRDFVIDSAIGRRVKEPIDTEVYRLSRDMDGQPSCFQIVFLIGSTRYRYGFEVDRHSVTSEWLYQTLRTKETELFYREKNKFTVSTKFDDARSLVKNTRSNALLLSVVAQFNGKISRGVLDWFENISKIVNRDDEENYATMSIDALIENNRTEDIITLVKGLDLGIENIKIVEIPIPELQGFSKSEIKTTHWKYDDNDGRVAIEDFDLEAEESAGTQKLFYISKLLIDLLDEGGLLIVDELDARLHPLITCAIVKLFNSSKTNPHNAQLIFTTHDTNLLSCGLFRKDQIWFTEKNRYGATDLYSLVEYQIPDDAPFEQDYIAGRYGAVPFIGDLSRLLGK